MSPVAHRVWLALAGGGALAILVWVARLGAPEPSSAAVSGTSETNAGSRTLAPKPVVLAASESPRTPVAVEVQEPDRSITQPLHWTEFRDASRFLEDRTFNSGQRILDAEQRRELDRLLAEIDARLRDARTSMHAVAARYVPDAVARGLARPDPGGDVVDRVGDRQLRVFLEIAGQQHYIDFDRHQFPELDGAIEDRDALIQAGHDSVVSFFTALSKEQ